MYKYIYIYQNRAYDNLDHLNRVNMFFPLVGSSRDLMELRMLDEPPLER
jgi:hypothetical protein